MTSKALLMLRFFKIQMESIKFSHSVFALPFALIATLLARRGRLPTGLEVIHIVLAMVGARTWAMGVNRAVDAKIDAANPRTNNRPIPSQALSVRSVWVFSVCGAVVFLYAAGWLSVTALLCAPFVLFILASYSYAKRFTFLCHFWLGFCLGLAPLGAWVALQNEFPVRLLVLTAAILFWVGGFDIIYATQDEVFDRANKLHSIPARFGTRIALAIARASHVIAALCFVQFGLMYGLGWTYFTGLAFVAVFMIAQHRLATDPQKINFAFFNLNGWIAVTLLSVTALSLYLENPGAIS
jgi:4-hydroxybenzoate polyprenyltransferase